MCSGSLRPTPSNSHRGHACDDPHHLRALPGSELHTSVITRRGLQARSPHSAPRLGYDLRCTKGLQKRCSLLPMRCGSPLCNYHNLPMYQSGIDIYTVSNFSFYK